MAAGKKTGGRQKGTKNKTTLLKEQERADIIASATAEGETPLEYMLRVMRTSTDTKRRDAMAVAAAPFVHPKLAAVEHSGDKDNPVTFEIVTGVPQAKDEPKSNGHAHPH